MRRRARRIYPPYWICLAAVVALTTLGLSGNGLGNVAWMTPSRWLGNLTLTESWRPLVFGEGRSYFIDTAWTLCYEEQFYLICGLLLAARRDSFFVGVAIITALTLPIAWLTWSGAINTHGFFFDGYWFQFAAGVLVYHGRNFAGPVRQRAYTGLLLGAAGVVLALALALPPVRLQGIARAGFLNAMALAFAFAALLLAIGRWDAPLSRTPALRPFQFCGIMCYSLYLTHQVVIVAFRTACRHLGLGGGGSTIGPGEALVTFIGTIVVGALFHRLVERHFLNASALRTPPVTR